ncbi:MAG: di-heme oxidoredictase family protein [Thermodesulfobacteriota bacterium]
MRWTLSILCIVFLPLSAAAQPIIGERPAVETHLDQAAIDTGKVGLAELIAHGQLLFNARFNRLDGQGRPASTGTGEPRVPDEPAFIRTSAPESNSCAGCHAQPRAGGAGDFVTNVFVLAQALDPCTSSVAPEFSNERNTLGMMGAGPIEMLAREMGTELIMIREEARDKAMTSGGPVTRKLVAKGVDFGTIRVMPDGRVDPTGIEGVDWDLIIKPFHQKGAVVSIREFTNNAMNHHHGMQSVERFGKEKDADKDGVANELTDGDITALTIFQAALNTPGQLLPAHPARRAAAVRGEKLFHDIGCSACHKPSLVLKERRFNEPNPFNPAGNLRPADLPRPFSFDMTAEGPKPRLEKLANGGAIVRAFTDLKRHNLNDKQYNHFANEKLPQGTLNGFAPASDFTIAPKPRPTEEFLTRKLWDVGNTDPYGHRGDLTTITDAIHFHGGEARNSRDGFFGLPQADRNAVIEFLKTLQVLPDGSERIVSWDS